MIIDYFQIPKLVETNLEIQSGKEVLGASKLKSVSIIKSFVPEVSLYAKSEQSKLNDLGDAPSAGAYANINLFNGFRDFQQTKINQLSYEASDLEFKKTTNELVFLARQHFWQTIRVQENIKILNDYVQVNKNNRNLILKKVNSGLSPRSEEFIFKKIELELQEDILKANLELKILKIELAKTLSISPKEPLEINAVIDPSKFQYTKTDKRIDLAQVDRTSSILNAEKTLSSLWRMPRINLYAEQAFTDHKNGEFIEDSDTSRQLIGIKVILPLFSEKNLDSIDAQVKIRELTSANLKRQAQAQERMALESKIENVLEHLVSAIDISKNKVALTKEIMEKTFSEFKLGLKEANSLNEATAEYITARKDLIEHQIDYILEVEHSKVNVLE